MPKRSKQPGDDFITAEELAQTLKVHPRTILRLVERNELSAVRVGHQWRFRREWVNQWLEQNTIKRQERNA